MSINLNETGRIEYKTQWKEDDKATIKDIKNTYNYVKDLTIKLNKERNKVKMDIPLNNEFSRARRELCGEGLYGDQTIRLCNLGENEGRT